MRYIPEFGSRFRILKGGKISSLAFTTLLVANLLSSEGKATEFSVVGNPNISPSEVDKAVIAFSSTKVPYVFSGQLGGTTPLTVKKLVGTTWENVSTDAIVRTNDNGYNTPSSIIFDNTDTPYVFYRNSSLLPEAKKFNGTSWENIGVDSNISSASGYGLIVKKYNNTFYVAMDERVPNSKYAISIKKLNGTIFEQVGPTLGTDKDEYKMAIQDESNIYVAYRDRNNNYKLTVQKYDGTSWSQIGTTLTEGNFDSLNLILDSDGTLNVLYIYNGVGYLKKYNSTTSSWDDVLSSSDIGSWTKCNLLFGTNNKYLACSLYGSSVVKKINGTTLENLSNTDAPSIGSTLYGNFLTANLDSDDTLYIAKSYMDSLLEVCLS